MTESEFHKKIKQKIYQKLRDWYGASIPEYKHEAHELDVYAVTSNGISIYVEVIYDSSHGHFRDDLLIIERSNADIIVVFVHPKILKNDNRVKEYEKTLISKRKNNIKMSHMLNGELALNDENYVNYDLKQIIDIYILEIQSNRLYLNKFNELKYELETIYSPLFAILHYLPEQVEEDVIVNYESQNPRFDWVINYYDKKTKEKLDNIIEKYGYLLKQKLYYHWLIEIKDYDLTKLEKWFVDDIIKIYNKRKKEYDSIKEIK